MSQNIGRLPILDSTTPSWSVAENPFGDDELVAGYVPVCFDPVTNEHIFAPFSYSLHSEAAKWIEDYIEERMAF